MKRIILGIILIVCVQTGFGQEILNKAKGQLATGDTTAAIRSLEDAVKAGQRTAEANFLLGSIAYNRSQFTQAVQYLESSLRVTDDNVDAIIMLGKAYTQVKNIPAALDAFRRAQKVAPKNANVSVGYGLALLAADSIDAAIVQLTRAREVEPNNAAVPMALGDAYLKQNVVPLAITNYQKAAELAPKDLTPHWKMALAYERQREYEKAVAEYKAVVDIDSTYAPAYLNVGKIYIRAAGQQKRLAVPPLKRYTELRPKDAEGAALYARALSLVEDYPAAAAAAKRALDLDPKNPEMMRVYANALVELKDYKTAMQYFDQLRTANQLKPEDQMKIGIALQGLGRTDEALKNLLAAVAIDSTNCDAYFPLGSIYMVKKDYAKAAEMFEKKIACDPRSLSSYLNGAASYIQTKDYNRARDLLLKALELKPDFLQARLWLGRYYAIVDSLDQAKTQYEQVLKDISDNPDAHRKEAGEAYAQIGAYYFTAKQYGRAAETYRRAVSQGYDNAGLQLSWGMALMQTIGNLSPEEKAATIQESIQHFRKTIAQEPNNPLGHQWLADALIYSRVPGEDEKNRAIQEEACSEYRKTLKLDPKNNQAKKGMATYSCK